MAHMRTNVIFENIDAYAKRMEEKLKSITSRTASLLGDSLILATSIVYLGQFSPEEREKLRSEIYDYLTKVRLFTCNKMWVEIPANSANPNKSIFITFLKDLGLRSIVNKNSLPPVLSAH